MTAALYSTREWRELPRDGTCVISFLFGEEAVGPCHGETHRHHVIPGEPTSRSVQVCASHHPTLEAALRRLRRPRRRTCPHVHRTREAREQCEARLNQAA
jgi:hypothetical protein